MSRFLRRMHRMGRPVMMWVAPAIVSGVLACSNDAAGPPVNPASQYWSLTLNHHAITLATVAPYDTLTLVATARTATGAVLTTDDAGVTYTSSDTSVQVSADGTIRAHTTADLTSDVQIIAKMTVGGTHGVTLADTARVNIVKYATAAEVPVVAHLELRRTDTAIFQQGYGGFFQGTALDTSVVPQPIPSVQVYYYMPPSLILQPIDHFSSGVQATGIGRATLYANATVYGKVVQDSVRLISGHRLQRVLTVGIDSSGVTAVPAGFLPDTVFIGVGGTVIWHNVRFGLPNDSVDLEFTGPAAVQPMDSTVAMSVEDPTADGFFRYLTIIPDGGGDIPAFAALPPTVTEDATGISAKGRRFTVPGTYTYHSRFFPGTGVITVISNADIP